MSSCFIRILTPQGLEPVAYTAASLSEAERFEPHDGVYTVTNTFSGGLVLKFDAHLDRLEDSAARAGIPLQLDRSCLRAALREMIAASGFEDVRFRITVPAEQPDSLILTLEPFRPLPPETYERGVRCITVAGSARHNPTVKSSGWLHERRHIEAALPEGIFTALLLGENDEILEGTSSNFYAVLDGELRTAGSGVLPGIAQQIVFAVAGPIIAVKQIPITVHDLPRCSEAFITSSSRGIVPVIEIDGCPIGEAVPGSITRSLRAAYLDWVAAHAEPL